MKKFTILALLLLGLSIATYARERSDEVGRLEAASVVLDEIMAARDSGIPEELLSSAKCVAVVPSLLKGGFIVGGQYGKGVATCRTDAGWSAPAFFQIAGGSIGFQIGGQAVDYVMLIMDDNGMRNLLSSKFKLGAEASVAAGPVGRYAEGMTDWKFKAQVLTYSRAHGVFAGVALNGASIRQDKDATRDFYGRMVPFRTTLTGHIAAPEDAKPFLTTVAKYAAEAQEETHSAQTTAAPASSNSRPEAAASSEPATPPQSGGEEQQPPSKPQR